MEQKQLDEMDEAFSGEEFIDDYEDEDVVIEDALPRKEAASKGKRGRPKKAKEARVSTAAHAGKKNEFEGKSGNEERTWTGSYEKEKEKPSTAKMKEPIEISSRVDPWADEKEPARATELGMDTTGDTDDSGFKASTWKIITGIAIILLILSVFTQGFNFDFSTKSPESSSSTEAPLSLKEGEQKVLSFVNTNLLRPPYQAQVQSSQEVNGLYQVTLTVAGQVIDSYLSKDGKLFFPQGLNTTQNRREPGTAGTEETGTSNARTAGTETAGAESPGITTNTGGAINTAAVAETTPEEATASTTAAGSAASAISADDDPAIGNSRAPVTVVEFSDFQCPSCKKFSQEILPQLKQEYIASGKVKFASRDFPLRSHPQAQSAALAAECAHEQGRYWEYHDLLFQHQDSLTESNYKQWARELNLNTLQFNACVDHQKYLAEVNKDFNAGTSYGVTGTPTFFVNGQMITGTQPYSTFKSAIEQALSGRVGGTASSGSMAPAPTESGGTTEPAPTESTPAATTSTTAVQPTATPTPTQFTLNAKRWLFNPNKITVTRGNKITFTITPQDLDFTFAIPNLGIRKEVKGQTTIEFTPTKAGVFEFSCSSCEDWRGMTGTLVVK